METEKQTDQSYQSYDIFPTNSKSFGVCRRKSPAGRFAALIEIGRPLAPRKNKHPPKQVLAEDSISAC